MTTPLLPSPAASEPPVPIDPGADAPGTHGSPPAHVDELRHHRVQVITFTPGSGDRCQSTEGTDTATAAWLRAIADQLDPPEPPHRPTWRDHVEVVLNEPPRLLPRPGDLPPPGHMCMSSR